MAISLFSLLKASFLSLTLISIFLFFLLLLHLPHPKQPSTTPHRSLLSTSTTTTHSCSSILSTNGFLNYLSLHHCLFNQNPFLSIPSLSLLLLLFFYILIKTAQAHFSVITTKLSLHLNLSPSMGAVTLLALGNGAPDVFASVAAIRGGQYRTGFGAILSAGTFVSSFVVGFVAIYASPFSVDPVSFIRDVLFYLVAALFLFYVYLSGEIFLWQAVGFVGFYVFFVGFVFWMDLGLGGGERERERDRHGDMESVLVAKDCEIGGGLMDLQEEKEPGFGFRQVCGLVCFFFQILVVCFMKMPSWILQYLILSNLD